MPIHAAPEPDRAAATVVLTNIACAASCSGASHRAHGASHRAHDCKRYMSVNFRGDECMFHFFLSPESAHCDIASIQNQTAREGTDRLIQKGFA